MAILFRCFCEYYVAGWRDRVSIRDLGGENNMADIIKELVTVVKALGVRFTLNGTAMTVEDVLAPNSMLPAIAKRADQLAYLCLGYGIGVTFEEAQESKLGSRAVFDSTTPNILRYLCILDVISELMRNKDMGGNTPLDELMYD